MSGRFLATGSLALGAALLALSSAPHAQQPPSFRSDTNTVAVYVTVTDKNGRLVSGLTRDDFEIEDNGKRQTITVFDVNPQPITSVLLIDRSGSVNTSFGLVQKAVDQFVARMLPPDRARVGTFSYTTIIEPDTFTHDRGELMIAVRNLPPQGGPSPIWNTLDAAIGMLRPERGRRVVLLLTDGYDAPGTRQNNVSLATALDHARESDVMVYCLGLMVGVRRPTELDPAESLGHLAAQTGGGFITLHPDVDLVSTLEGVSDELHSQYALGFVPEKLDGTRHTLRVRMKRGDLRARSRLGYRASPPAR